MALKLRYIFSKERNMLVCWCAGGMEWEGGRGGGGATLVRKAQATVTSVSGCCAAAATKQL